MGNPTLTYLPVLNNVRFNYHRPMPGVPNKTPREVQIAEDRGLNISGCKVGSIGEIDYWASRRQTTFLNIDGSTSSLYWRRIILSRPDENNRSITARKSGQANKDNKECGIPRGTNLVLWNLWRDDHKTRKIGDHLVGAYYVVVPSHNISVPAPQTAINFDAAVVKVYFPMSKLYPVVEY